MVVDAEDEKDTAEVTGKVQELLQVLFGGYQVFEGKINGIEDLDQFKEDILPEHALLCTEDGKIAGKDRAGVTELDKLLVDLVGMVLATDVLGDAPDGILGNAGIVGHVWIRERWYLKLPPP